MVKPSPAIQPRLLQEAAEWLVQMQSGTATMQDQEALQRWCERSDQHRQAWQRAEALLLDLHKLPSDLTRATLNRRRLLGRRRVLQGMLSLATVSVTGWVLHEQWAADFRTPVGQLRDLTLPDGSALTLGTATAVDLRFSASLRELRLRTGEVMVTVASDATRPFRVTTRHGSVQALGTRFSVRKDEDATRVAVLEHSVLVQPESSNGTGALVLHAKQQTAFTRQEVAPAQPTPNGVFAWAKGMLIVEDWPLREVLDELARYRPGILRCATEVADLRISGVFPLLDTESSLNLLAASFPLKVRSLSRYWVTVEGR